MIEDSDLTYPLYRVAKVVEDDDSSKQSDSKKGGIQVKIFPELNDVSDSDLPWAYPKDSSGGGMGSSAEIGQHRLPMKDTFVYVEIMDPAYQYIYYYPFGPHSFSKYIYDTAKGNLDIDDYSPPGYPEPQLQQMPDGSVFFYDRTNGDMGLQHSSGLYVFFGKDGNLKIRVIDNFEVRGESTDDLTIKYDKTTGEFKLKMSKVVIDVTDINLGDANPTKHAALFEPLNDILGKLLTHIHVSPAGPTGPAMESTMTPLAAQQANLPQIQSQTTKVK